MPVDDYSGCVVIYINAVDVESLTGPAAVERAVNVTLEMLKSVGLTTTLAHFKLSSQGITITDNKHRFRYLHHSLILNIVITIVITTTTRNPLGSS